MALLLIPIIWVLWLISKHIPEFNYYGIGIVIFIILALIFL